MRKPEEKIGNKLVNRHSTTAMEEVMVAVTLSTETAAETCAHYWSVDRWGGRTAYGFLEVEAPNRYKWAEKWVPISIDARLLQVVSIPDQNLAAVIRKTLGLEANARITSTSDAEIDRIGCQKKRNKRSHGIGTRSTIEVSGTARGIKFLTSVHWLT